MGEDDDLVAAQDFRRQRIARQVMDDAPVVPLDVQYLRDVPGEPMRSTAVPDDENWACSRAVGHAYPCPHCTRQFRASPAR